MQYKLKILKETYAVCFFEKGSSIPSWIDTSKFYSITETEDELSVVCTQEKVPINIKCEKNWKIIKIDSILDFSMVGVISEISTLLASNKISIFVMSTFNTDYICIQENFFEKTLQILKDAGNIISE